MEKADKLKKVKLINQGRRAWRIRVQEVSTWEMDFKKREANYVTK